MKQSHIDKFNGVYRNPSFYYGMELRQEFTDFFDHRDLAGKNALDLGCGEGRYSLYLARKGCRVTAIDRAEAGVEKLAALAESRQLDVHAHTMDVDAFEYDPNRFDIIVAATILDHLDEGRRIRLVETIRAGLKPGGILYASVFTVDDPGFLVQQGAADVPPNTVSDTADCMTHYFDRAELLRLFSDLHVRFYYEGVEPDTSHGRHHRHGWACLLAWKPMDP
jgi:tellurite methyltransferase